MAVNPPATEPSNAELLHEVNMLRAQVDFPLADRDILKLISGTPEEIRGAAQRLHEQAKAAQAATAAAVAPPAPVPAPAVPANEPPAGGGPVPIPGQGQVTPPEHQVSLRYQELLGKAESRSLTPEERDEFFKAALRGDSGTEGWNTHIAKLNQRPGRS